MKYCINPDECKNFNIGVDTFLYLLSLYLNKPIDKNTISEICKEGLVDIDGFDINQQFINPRLNMQGLDTVEEILANSKLITSNDTDTAFLNLAEQLIEIYPKGKKPGTSYMWRDSKSIIAKKLKNVANKYNISFTNQEAIDATRRYVASFNGNYTYMQLLKYFILKKDKFTGEENSQFLSYLENREEANTTISDIGELV
jgi:hypothetical protein